jgi:hypothetical protein
LPGCPFSLLCRDFFLVWWSSDFAAVFAEKRCFYVVFWW